MAPIGIIYEAAKSEHYSEEEPCPKYQNKFLHHFLRAIGGGLVGFAVIALTFSYYPVVRDGISYELKKSKKIGFGDLLNTNAVDFGLDPFFSIYVPKINAKASIVPNVDSGNYKEYTNALQKGVAHAAGTNFPGQGKLIYLFSHSTSSALTFAKYNAIFFLLKKVEKGDKINIFYLGENYEYIVQEKLIVEASDNSWLVDKNMGEYLVLQTCDPPGTSIRRLVVIAKPTN